MLPSSLSLGPPTNNQYKKRMSLIYKICMKSTWLEAEAQGVFTGAPVDIADGYIHFSTGQQIRDTAARHFHGQHDLIIASIDIAALGAGLKWEKSRGGDLFPHLYGPLPMSAVRHVVDLPLGKGGIPVIPEWPL